MTKKARRTTFLAAATLGTALALTPLHHGAAAQDATSPTSWQELVEEARKALDAADQAAANDASREAQAKLLRDAFDRLVSAMATLDAKLEDAADAEGTNQRMSALAQRITALEAETTNQGRALERAMKIVEGLGKAGRQPQTATTGQAGASHQGAQNAPTQGGPVKLTMYAKGGGTDERESFSVMNTGGRCIEQWSGVLLYSVVGSDAPMAAQPVSAGRLEPNRPMMLKKGERGETQPLDPGKFIYHTDPGAEQYMRCCGYIPYTVALTDQRWKECG